MKKNKGFTLVELLAVIVILAIIMIIAIPAVLNTMETAKKKSMVNFANKLINELSKQYVAKMTFDNYIRPADDTFIVFDITKDLGLTNTGEYYGLAAIELLKDDDGKEYTNYDVEIYSNDYYLSYNTYSLEHGGIKLDVDLIENVSVVTSSLPEGTDLKELPLKKLDAAANLKTKCWSHDLAFVDGPTNTQIYCNRDANPRSDYDNNNQCKLTEIPKSTRFLEALEKYKSGEDPVTCVSGIN